MKATIIPLNSAETYPCRLSVAKEFFRNTEISLCFSRRGKEFTKKLHHPLYQYVSKYIKGKVIFYALIGDKQKDPLFVFYELNSNEYSEKLQHKFERILLPQVYNCYLSQLNNMDTFCRSQWVLIELLNEDIHLHQIRLRK